MCLDRVYDAEKKKRMIDALPGGWLEVYRCVKEEYRTGRYSPLCWHKGRFFRVGINRNKKEVRILSNYGIKYMSGYHSYRAKSSVRDWWGVRIKCHIRKEWITDIGSQDGVVYITNCIKMPSCKDKAARYNPWR